jgi:hypothetical protein
MTIFLPGVKTHTKHGNYVLSTLEFFLGMYEVRMMFVGFLGNHFLLWPSNAIFAFTFAMSEILVFEIFQENSFRVVELVSDEFP